ncbi:MAG: DNA repair protein RecO [Pseudomonadota bacterium]
MEWKDEGVILGVRRHGEGSVIVEAMTENHGRHLGLARGGRSARMRPILQPGNSVHLTWRARLDEHLGQYTIDADALRAARLMETQIGLYGLQLLAAHMRLLPERDPHRSMYDAGIVILDNLDEPAKAAHLIIRFEIALLDELGFGLDLANCAATGQTTELVFVSPKSGKAVSREAGKPWASKMLALPPFLSETAQRQESDYSLEDVEAGFALSGFFLDRHVWAPRGIRPPDEREGVIRNVLKELQRMQDDQPGPATANRSELGNDKAG